METLSRAALAIISEQYRIIGPLAVEQARLVDGVGVDWDAKKVTLVGDGSMLLGRLVEQYRLFFGQTSVEVCRDAAQSVLHDLPPAQVPAILR